MATTRMQQFATVDQYIAAQPEELQPKLRQLRQLIRNAAPTAEEGFGYGMPAYTLHGPLIYFANFKKHFGLYALPSAVDVFKDELARYKTSKGTIQLPHDAPLPVKLITAIVKFRVRENEEKAARKAKAKKTKA